MDASEFLPADRHDLEALRQASARCQACDLYEHATQTVFGDGNPQAAVMVVENRPGDKAGSGRGTLCGSGRRPSSIRPWEQAGLERSSLYVTNAVKHFKWEPRGKVRLHKKPGAREVAACKPWLLAELDAVHPEIVLCLGATAAQALLGPGFRVTRQRGQIVTGPADIPTVATVHPSSILRARDKSERSAQLARFVQDLRVVVEFQANQFGPL